MNLEFLTDLFFERATEPALIWGDQVYTYEWLLKRFNDWHDVLSIQGITQGMVVALKADFSPDAVALLLSLISLDTIIAPIAPSVPAGRQEEFEQIAQVESVVTLPDSHEWQIFQTGREASHPLFDELRTLCRPGLILFSSGSTGKSKAAVHDFHKLLNKYRVRRKNLVTLAFLLFDHIGGLDTLFYALSNGSSIVTVQDRSVDTICQAIEKYRVEVLPVTPTFLNLLSLSDVYEAYDLSSLQIVTYGTEVMPKATLERAHAILPKATFLQKYGTTEVGTLRSKSRSSDSVWVRIGGEGYQTRVVNNMLEIKAESAMLGYINAPSPFTEDGWFITGDIVEVEGDYLRILGRNSDLINVGGQKVYPAEVENVILELDDVIEVRVYGEANPILGEVVCADIRTLHNLEARPFTHAVKKHCASKLDSYKVPMKVNLIDDIMHTERFKLKRHPMQSG